MSSIVRAMTAALIEENKYDFWCHKFSCKVIVDMQKNY